MQRLPSQRRGGESSDAILIAVRFLTTDQWFRTHVDPSWTISELKQHLLARCVGGTSSAANHSGPRLLIPSQQGKITLAGLVRPPHAPAIKSSTRPNTAANEENSRRKPRLSLKVVPGLSKSTPRPTVANPSTPARGLVGPSSSATGPRPLPSVHFSAQNPFSSPDLSPPLFAKGPYFPEDDSMPSSPTAGLDSDAASVFSRTAAAEVVKTSPTFSSNPPSRPFSPIAYGAPDVTQAKSPPLLTKTLSASSSPYATKPPTPTATRSLHSPTPLVESPPPLQLSQSGQDLSSLERRLANMSIDSVTGTLPEGSVFGSDSTHSPLLSVFEFLDTEEPTFNYRRTRSAEHAAKSSSPPRPSTGGGLIKSGVELLTGGKIRGKASREEIRGRKREEEIQDRKWHDDFQLVSFGLSCVLDEFMTIEDSRIRPGELIEIQRVNASVHLARSTYIQPYFEAPVYVLKQSSSSSSARAQNAHAYHHQPPVSKNPYGDYLPQPLLPPAFVYSSLEPLSPAGAYYPPGPSNVRTKSGTATPRDVWGSNVTPSWNDQTPGWAEPGLSTWESINEGRRGSLPAGRGDDSGLGTGAGAGGEKMEWKLKWMVMREGNLTLYRERAGQEIFSRALDSLLSAQQLPARPALGTLPSHYISVRFTESSKRGDGELGLRMMDDAAHTHCLRVLLRTINTPGQHSLLPTDTARFVTQPFAFQYPEWRQYVVQSAWLAGRGTSQLHGGRIAGPWMRSPWQVLTEEEIALLNESDDPIGSMFSGSDPGSETTEEAIFGRRDDSENEWDAEGNNAQQYSSIPGGDLWSGDMGLGGLGLDSGRPRSKSLATPEVWNYSSLMVHPVSPALSPQPSQAYGPLSLSPTPPPEQASPLVPSSSRRKQSSTIAEAGVPSGSPMSTSPTARSPVSTISPTLVPTITSRRSKAAGDASTETAPRTSGRRAVIRTRHRASEAPRQGSTHSLEMQRAVPSGQKTETTPMTEVDEEAK